MGEQMLFFGLGSTAWTAIATFGIVIATIINIVLFCIFQFKQNKISRANLEMLYIQYYLKCIDEAVEEGLQIVEKYSEKSPEKIDEKVENVKEGAKVKLRAMSRHFKKLGMKDMVLSINDSLVKAFKKQIGPKLDPKKKTGTKR